MASRRQREKSRTNEPLAAPRRWRPLVLVGGVVVLAAALGIGYRAGWLATRPAGLNVLLITLDTTRADHLGCYGSTTAMTPNLDRLARDGTLFKACRTCSPLTLPSHSSIMTGLYPFVHGARQNGMGRLAQANVTLAETLRDAGYRTEATIASFVLNQRFGLSQGFDVYHDVATGAAGDQIDAERKGHQVCDDAVQMLNQLARQRFFLWVHFYDAHHPYESKRHADQDSPAAYADEVGFVDTQVGRLMQALREHGLDRNTLVVVVGDHGEGLGEHDELTHGYFVYETTQHVPLILRCPGRILAGRTVDTQVRTIDIAPTILALLERSPWSQAQGVSLLPLLADRTPPPKLAAYADSSEAHVQFGVSAVRSLTDGRWKYILAPKPELYDLENDPHELHNLAAERDETAAALRTEMRNLIADAPPPPPPEFATATLDRSEIARLESLGYVAAEPRSEDLSGTELDRFEPHGPNAADYAALYRLVTLSRGAVAANRLDEAERLLRPLTEQLPDAPQPLTDLAHILHLQGRTEESFATFQRALTLAPEDSHVRGLYGEALLGARRWEDAVAQFTAILQKTPDNTTALYSMGIALASLNQFDKARAHFELALRIEPNNARVLHGLGVLCSRQNRAAEAADYFAKALTIDPNFKQCEIDLQRVRKAMGP